MRSLPISLIFVTHNRKEQLYKALSSAYMQTVAVEIIVMDDASTDGTEDMVSFYFPNVIYHKSNKCYGPSFQRNEGAKKAKSDIIVFLDDDTILTDEGAISKTVHDFDYDNIGAVAIPFINILQNNKVVIGAPDKSCTYVCHAFVAAAFAIKKDIFLELGGFRKEYFYMGEEGDFCIRLLEAGYLVKAGTSNPVHHLQPLERVSYAADYYGRRNDVLFIYLNVPRIYFITNLIGSVIKGIWFGVKVSRLVNMLRGMAAGLSLMYNKEIKKMVRPVKKDVFLKYRFLKHNEPLSLDQLNSIFKSK